MIIGILKEQSDGEKRVALAPTSVLAACELGFKVQVELNAGVHAGFSNEDYIDCGASIVNTAEELVNSSEIVIKIRAPEDGSVSGTNEQNLLKPGQILISLIAPGQNPDLLSGLANKGVTALAMDAVPRISRAQKLDTLSSMENVAGYRAVVEAANHYGRFFTGQVTAAGKVPHAIV